MSLSDKSQQSLLQKLDQYHQRSLGPEEAKSDSKLVLSRILECGRYSSEESVTNVVDEYVGGRPLAYITGSHKFGALDLTVRPPVYIPRIETEQWVILLGELIYSTISAQTTPSFTESRPFRILDICSGSGCIPLLLAKLGQGKIHTVGLEVDDRALAVARENATRNGIDHLARFEKFDLFEDGQDAQEDLKSRLRTDGRDGFGFDMVVSNPPYVSSEDMRKVEKTWHEGKFALQGKLRGRNGSIGEDAKQEAAGDEEVLDGDDGYSFYRRIKTVYPAFLDESAGTIDTLPKLVLEVGSTQSRPVQEMYASEGRLEIQRETARRKEIGAPKLEDGDMVGTERSIWIYRQA